MNTLCLNLHLPSWLEVQNEKFKWYRRLKCAASNLIPECCFYLRLHYMTPKSFIVYGHLLVQALSVPVNGKFMPLRCPALQQESNTWEVENLYEVQKINGSWVNRMVNRRRRYKNFHCLGCYVKTGGKSQWFLHHDDDDICWSLRWTS